MVKAMGRQRRGSKTGGVEPATISLGVLAAIAGVAGYGSTRGQLSESDQLKVEAAVRARLEIERAKNPRSAPCPDFKSERDRLLGKLAEYESSETRFRLATPDQIVKVVETVKEKLGVKMSGGEPEGQKEAVKEIEEMQTPSEPTSVATSEPVAESPAAVEPVADTVVPPVTDPVVPPVADPVVPPVAEPVVPPVAEPVVPPVPDKPTAETPITAELLPKPDLVKAGVILDSIPKAFSRPRLITVLIKLESVTREPLETLRKYFDEAFAKLEPGSKTPLKDALRKMRERGKKPVAEPVVPEPVVAPVVEPTPEPVVAPVIDPVVEPTPEPVVAPVVEPTPEPVVAPVADTAEAVVPTVAPEPVIAPVAEPTPEPVVAPAAPPKRTRRRNVQPGIAEKLKELDKSGIVNQGGTRKKKLRTRRRDKQNVRRSSGRKNRSNRTDTYSSRRTEVDASGDELGL
jgi:hypothetical protein